MKTARHEAILSVIDEYEIDTQEALLEKLSEKGFAVTQATVSRDIKDLALTKIITPSGKYKYARPKTYVGTSGDALGSYFAAEVHTVDSAVNTVVVKCSTGMAQAVCAKLDEARLYGVVGTLAGDDTIFVVMKTQEDAQHLCTKLSALLQINNGEVD